MGNKWEVLIHLKSFPCLWEKVLEEWEAWVEWDQDQINNQMDNKAKLKEINSKVSIVLEVDLVALMDFKDFKIWEDFQTLETLDKKLNKNETITKLTKFSMIFNDISIFTYFIKKFIDTL